MESMKNNSSDYRVRDALGAADFETTEEAARRVAGACVKLGRDLYEARNCSLVVGSNLHTALCELSDLVRAAGRSSEGDTWVNVVRGASSCIRQWDEDRERAQRSFASLEGILDIERKAAGNNKEALAAVTRERDNLRLLVTDLRSDLGLRDTEDLRPKVQFLRANFLNLQSRVRAALDASRLDN